MAFLKKSVTTMAAGQVVEEAERVEAIQEAEAEVGRAKVAEGAVLAPGPGYGSPCRASQVFASTCSKRKLRQ